MNTVSFISFMAFKTDKFFLKSLFPLSSAIAIFVFYLSDMADQMESETEFFGNYLGLFHTDYQELVGII